MYINDGSENMFLYSRHVLPVDPVLALQGHPLARWFASGGTQGKGTKDPQLLKAMELFGSAPAKKPQERIKIGQEIWRIIVDGQLSIGVVGLSPAVMGVRIVSRRLGNTPARQVNAQHARTPCSSHPETFFFKS
jgi:peptide/nickel transport system substrate-binding protein